MILSLLVLACGDPEPTPEPAPPPEPEAPELRATREGPCWVLPDPILQHVSRAPDGRLLLSARDRSGGRDALRLWWLDPKTDRLEEAGPATGPRPEVLPDGSWLRARSVPLAGADALSRRVGEALTLVAALERVRGDETTPLSAPGHDVTSFQVRGDEVLYAAGRRLWRVSLDGGPPEVVAEGVMDLFAAPEGGALVVDMDHDNALQLGVIDAQGVRTPLGEGLNDALVVGDTLWVQRHPTAPLRRGPLTGPLVEVSPQARLLPGGWLSEPIEGGAALHPVDEPSALRLLGPPGVRELLPADEGLYALVVQDTAPGFGPTPLDEADLCLLPREGELSLPARRLPRRFLDLEARLAGVDALRGVSLVDARAEDAGETLLLTSSGGGPLRAKSLRELVDAAQAALPEPQPALVITFEDSNRFASVDAPGPHRQHRLGYAGVLRVVDPSEYPVRVDAWSAEAGTCSGELTNTSGRPSSLQVACGPFDNPNVIFTRAPPPQAVSPSPMPPDARGRFSVSSAGSEALRLRFTDDEGVVPHVHAEAAREAEVLFRALLDISEGRPMRVERPPSGFGTLGGPSEPWALRPTPELSAPELLLILPASFTEDAAKMRLLAEDMHISLGGLEVDGAPLVDRLRVSDERGRLWRLEGDALTPAGQRSVLGGL